MDRDDFTPYTYPYSGQTATRRNGGFVVAGTNRFTHVPTGPGRTPYNSPQHSGSRHQLPTQMQPVDPCMAIDKHPKVFSMSPEEVLKKNDPQIHHAPNLLSEKVYVDETGNDIYPKRGLAAAANEMGFPMVAQRPKSRATIIDIKNSNCGDKSKQTVLPADKNSKNKADDMKSEEDGYVLVTVADEIVN